MFGTKNFIAMREIKFSEEIQKAAPNLRVLQVEAQVSNSPTSDRLWKKIGDSAIWLRENFKIEDIKNRPAIAATRAAYKALGKDPNRYRPSAEALCRRILNGKGIYRLTTLIDVINLISIETGFSIGGFDADKIAGDTLTLSVGIENETFEAIGRGQLNIGGLPVYRDAEGPIGTPTSDVERTKLSIETTNLLMLVNMYADDEEANDNKLMEYIAWLLSSFASSNALAFTIRPCTAHY